MPLNFPRPQRAASRICRQSFAPSACAACCEPRLLAELQSFQASTVEALADYLIVEARKLELTNKTITFEEMKAAAKTLKDHAQELAPRAADAEERGNR
jgi:hypothetical protein